MTNATNYIIGTASTTTMRFLVVKDGTPYTKMLPVPAGSILYGHAEGTKFYFGYM